MSEAASAVRWLLQQEEPEARRVAVRQLAKVRGPEAMEFLLRALGDDDWRVRKEAAAIAPSLEDRVEVVAGLVAALDEKVNIGLRNAAVEALVAVGRDAVGATVEALPRLDADARKLAVEVLGGTPEAGGMGALIALLSDEDPNVRVAAAEALGGSALAGDDWRRRAADSLTEILGTAEDLLRIAALDSLTRLEVQLPWRVLEPFMASPLLRRYAIAGAAGAREPEAVRALTRATGDESLTIAREALVVLGDVIAVEPDDRALLEVARGVLSAMPGGCKRARAAAVDSEDPRARGGALLALGLLGDVQDVPVFLSALDDDDVAERAELGIRLLGSPATSALLSCARSAPPRVRASALLLAAALADDQGELVRLAAIEALADECLEVVAAALEALGVVGAVAELARLAPYVVHDEDRIATTATEALSRLAARHVAAARALLGRVVSVDPLALAPVVLGAIAAVEPLTADDMATLQRALAHDSPRIRRTAVEALAQAGGDDVADAVSFALSDEERDVQLAAVRALGRLGRVGLLEQLATHSRDPGLIATALMALADADPERALAAARPLVSQPDVALACAGIEALGHIAAGAKAGALAFACEDALFQALDHPEPDAARLALSLVGARPGPRVFARLGLCLDHPSWELRRVAAELLAQDRSPAAQALLRARYEREADTLVRAAIAAAISLRPPNMAGDGSPSRAP